jgi:hypothetical protein
MSFAFCRSAAPYALGSAQRGVDLPCLVSRGARTQEHRLADQATSTGLRSTAAMYLVRVEKRIRIRKKSGGKLTPPLPIGGIVRFVTHPSQR